MMDALRSEFRKLTTVYSTYVISGVALLLVGFFSFYALGYKAETVLGPVALESAVMYGMTVAAVFAGIVAILQVCHEYRYNTIAYTLASSNNRLKVLLAKVLVLTLFAAGFAVFMIVFIISLTSLGAKAGGHDLGPQIIDAFELLWRSAAYTVGSVWLGMILGFIIRSLVGAVVVYFLLPSMIEPILKGFLRVDGNYLPTTAQGQILSTSFMPDVYSPLASLGIFALYMAAGWLVATILLVKRDAN